MGPNRRRGAGKAAAAAAARRQWKVGDLVLAKVKGFPAWPATVCPTHISIYIGSIFTYGYAYGIPSVHVRLSIPLVLVFLLNL